MTAAASPRRRFGMRTSVLNPVIRLVLSGPLHRMLSASTLLLTYTGTRSGRTYTLPVQYAGYGTQIVVLAAYPEHKTWWRNLRHRSPVQLHAAGTTVHGTGHVVASPENATPLIGAPTPQVFPDRPLPPAQQQSLSSMCN